MIFVYHINNKINLVHTQEGNAIGFDATVSIAKGLSQMANCYPNEKIVWCHLNYKESLNREALQLLFHHDKLLLSYCPGNSNYISKAIGYVDESLFAVVNKKVSYPGWQMSSIVGMIDSRVLIAIKNKIPFDTDFDYYLNSVAKLAMPLGLLCYSEPKLLKESAISYNFKVSNFTLFKFVRQHYKTPWLFLLFLNLLIYEKQFPFFPFLASFYFKRRKPNFSLDNIKLESVRKVVCDGTIDVIIPTIGRKKYLYDVLKDLAAQTHLPKSVIIVEQNPIEGSVSELDYLTNETWPFRIKHIFTHQAGACHARNLALEQVESEWVFLADDDIRIEKDFNTKMLEVINEIGVEVVSVCCIQKEEKPKFKTVFQWASFGSGCSFVKGEVIKKCKFNLGYEFGYGEDVDFGMQLRNLGHDIVYLPEPQILHLKAPIGGFRTKPVLQWQNDAIQPKPSPTVMLSHLLHKTKEQVLGYKTILFFKYYKHQKIKNPIRYFFCFRKQWNQSVLWANQLKNKKE